MSELKQIRDRLNIVPGTKLFILCDGENIILKPIHSPEISEFQDLKDTAESVSNRIGAAKDKYREPIGLEDFDKDNENIAKQLSDDE